MIQLPKTYLSIDFETTGLDDDGDVSKVDIIEAAVVLVENGKIIQQISGLACPPQPISEKITQITNITNNMLVGKPTPLEVFKTVIIPLFNITTNIVGNNILTFDRLFIEKYCKILNITPPPLNNYWDCGAFFKSIRQAHRAIKDLDLPKSQADLYNWTMPIMKYSYQQDRILWNLDASSRYLGVSPFGMSGERHRALFDAQLAHRVFEKIREELSQ